MSAIGCTQTQSFGDWRSSLLLRFAALRWKVCSTCVGGQVHRGRDRQAGRDTDKHTQIQTDKRAEIQAEKHTKGETDKRVEYVGVAGVVLQMIALGMGDPSKVQLPEAPPTATMESAITALTKHGCIGPDYELTPLGNQLGLNN